MKTIFLSYIGLDGKNITVNLNHITKIVPSGAKCTDIYILGSGFVTVNQPYSNVAFDLKHLEQSDNEKQFR